MSQREFSKYEELSNISGEIIKISKKNGKGKGSVCKRKLSLQVSSSTKEFLIACHENLDELEIYKGTIELKIGDRRSSILSPKFNVYNLKTDQKTYISYDNLKENNKNGRKFSFFTFLLMISLIIMYKFLMNKI